MNVLLISVLGWTKDRFFDYSSSSCVQIYSRQVRFSSEAKVRHRDKLFFGYIQGLVGKTITLLLS